MPELRTPCLSDRQHRTTRREINQICRADGSSGFAAERQQAGSRLAL
jgi:hypothetical protein